MKSASRAEQRKDNSLDTVKAETRKAVRDARAFRSFLWRATGGQASPLFKLQWPE